MPTSQGLASNLINLIEAFGGSPPSSYGLGELYEDLAAAISLFSVNPVPVTTKTANYIVQPSDVNTCIEVNSSSTVTITVPTTTFTQGQSILIRQIGSGTVIIAAGAGFTLTSFAYNFTLAGQWAAASISFRGPTGTAASTSAVLAGNLT
jgi:hypothetical protein